MGILITRKYDVVAEHYLTAGVPDSHGERVLHGHRYEVDLSIAGAPDDDGIVLEFEALDRVVVPVLALVKNESLNTLRERCSTPEASAVSANPTTERLAAWLAARLTGLVASAAGDTRPIALTAVTVKMDGRGAASWSRPVG